MPKVLEWPRVRQRRDGKWVVDCGRANGKRIQFTRRTEGEANTLAKEKRIERKNHGIAALKLTARQRFDAVEAFEILGGESIIEAARFYVDHKSDTARPELTITELFDGLIESQQRRRLSPNSLSATKVVLKPFVETFGEKLASAITREGVEDWLRKEDNGNCTTEAKRIRYVKLLFNYAVDREVLDLSPVRKLVAAQVQYSVPKVLKPEQVARVLSVAADIEPTIVAQLALGFFAGLRSCELFRLRWDTINLEDSIISVLKTKTRSGRLQSIPRHVEIEPNLMEWLIRYRKPSGPIGLQVKSFSRRRDNVCEKAGVTWVSNAMRHSFATYHLVAKGSADLTAAELGHIHGVKVLYRHYRGLATKREAGAYWKIKPSTVEIAGGCARIA